MRAEVEELEAEVKRLNELALHRHNRIAEERDLADRLAEALRDAALCADGDEWPVSVDLALAAYDEARRG